MTESCDEPFVLDNLKPGQLWSWKFSVGTGAWPVQRVNSEGRVVAFAGGHLMIVRGNVFTVVVVDDPGPYEMPVFETTETGIPLRAAPKRWHVVLLKDVLVWFQHDWFEQAELLQDVV